MGAIIFVDDDSIGLQNKLYLVKAVGRTLVTPMVALLRGGLYDSNMAYSQHYTMQDAQRL